MQNAKRIFIVGLALLIGSTSLLAQPKKVAVDKIAGIVGDQIILQSDITNSIADLARQGQKIPPNAECLIMQQALISKVLMLQAQKDSLPVTDEEVEADLDQRIRHYINQVGSQQELEQLAGKTVYQIKDEARESVREQKLAEAMQRKIVQNVRITPVEVKAFFDKIPKDSLPYYESELEICQIVIYPKATRAMEQYIYGEMMNYKKQIESGVTTFANLAKQVSEDPGSKDRGGQYQINRNEKTWDPVFMSTAFRLKDGEISNPVKSKFGYHLIQMVKRTGDDAIVRHILRIPPITEEDIDGAIHKLDTVRSQIIAGSVEFNQAASKYSEDEAAKFSGPCITDRNGSTYVTIDQLDKDMVVMLDKMKIGDISQPTVFQDERGQKGVRLVYLKSRSEPHRMNMTDDYSKIAQFALDAKKNKTLDDWIEAKMPTYYIMIDNNMEDQCPALAQYASEKKSF